MRYLLLAVLSFTLLFIAAHLYQRKKYPKIEKAVLEILSARERTLREIKEELKSIQVSFYELKINLAQMEKRGLVTTEEIIDEIGGRPVRVKNYQLTQKGGYARIDYKLGILK